MSLMKQKTLLLVLALIAAAGAMLSACTGPVPPATTAVSDPKPTTEATEVLSAGLRVYCFQAGKADAFLLWNSHGAVLIDTGESGFGKQIVKKLEELGIERLSTLILTHFDKDHVGGAKKVLQSVAVDQILQSNCPKPGASAYEKYLSALESEGLAPITVRETRTFLLGDVVFTVDPPAKETYEKDPSNNSSLIVSVVCGENRLLFTADALDARLNEYLSSRPGRFDFVKLPHHGKYQASLTRLLELTRPAYVLITSSEEEPEAEKTLQLLSETEAEVFFSRNAPVLLESDGKTLSVVYSPS